MRKRSLITVLACLAMGVMLLIPGSALAANAVTISSGATTTGGPTCSFTVTAAGQNINTTDLENCLASQNVTIADPPGDGGEIEVESPITANTCGATSLTLDEEGSGGSVVIGSNATTSVACTLVIEAGGTVTGSSDINAGTLDLETSGAVTLDSPGTNAIGALEGSVDGVVTIGTANPINIGAFSDQGGAVTMYLGASAVIDGALNVSGQLTLMANGSGRSVTEQGSGAIVAPTLLVQAGSDVVLDGSGNRFGLAPSYVAVTLSVPA